MSELGHHEPLAAVHHTHCFALLHILTMSGLVGAVAPRLTILAFDALPGIVALHGTPITRDIF